MRALVVAESVFGNTRRIAEEVARGLAQGLGESGQVRVADVSDPRSPWTASTSSSWVARPTRSR